jgi:DNA repair protein RadC
MTDEKPTYRITDLAESDRPRERLAQFGSIILNSAELLAILLRVGVPGENAVQVGYRLLNAFGGCRVYTGRISTNCASSTESG